MWNKINYNMLLVFVVALTLFAGGCSAVKGPRYWWDDQVKEKLPDDYMLPESPPQYPVPTDPEPYVPKELPEDEIKLATEQEKAQIELGIPRSGVPDPLTNRVVVPAEKYEDDIIPEDIEDSEIDYVEEGVTEDSESFEEAEASDQNEAAFAEEDEAVSNSSEAKDFIDEISEDYNYNFDGEAPAGEDYSYKDDPTPSESVYEKEEVVTDTEDKIQNIEGEDEPPLDPNFGGGLGLEDL